MEEKEVAEVWAVASNLFSSEQPESRIEKIGKSAMIKIPKNLPGVDIILKLKI